jgi:hypothetical protein
MSNLEMLEKEYSIDDVPKPRSMQVGRGWPIIPRDRARGLSHRQWQEFLFNKPWRNAGIGKV